MSERDLKFIHQGNMHSRGLEKSREINILFHGLYFVYYKEPEHKHLFTKKNSNRLLL